MRTTIVFFCGVICSLLVAAAAFRGGTPVDYTFTYQGQLRNAGVLVNGPVDLRITLWDSDAAGAQVGPINNYQALPITDGRFAVGLNFGGTAFDGSNRWVQLEFRSPAGSGQYLTLNPRDKIMATPYAMFALNGGNGIWNYNPKLQSVSVLGQKVGIGTANPTAALEVVGTGGDEAVKLPAGSIGASELLPQLVSATGSFRGQVIAQSAMTAVAVDRSFTTAAAGYLTIHGGGSVNGFNNPDVRVYLDGVLQASYIDTVLSSSEHRSYRFAVSVAVSPGTHYLRVEGSLNIGGYINLTSCGTISFSPNTL